MNLFILPRDNGGFPKEYPAGAILTITQYLRGTVTDKWMVMEAAYDLIGYFAGQVKDGLHLFGATANVIIPISDMAICGKLEECCKVGGDGSPPVAAFPPWLLTFLLQLFQKLLTS